MEPARRRAAHHEGMTSTQTAPAALPATLRLGAVHLTVTDLDRSVAFYQDALGLRQHRRDGRRRRARRRRRGPRRAARGARRPPRRPPRRPLPLRAAVPRRARSSRAPSSASPPTRTPIDGASDHGVSEAIYLPDPDGNGIELYADRPRDAWPPPPAPASSVGMFTRALDLHDLLARRRRREPVRHAGPGLRIGHVHLHVGDLDAARARSTSTCSASRSWPACRARSFVAAGGYHHHLGVNTWRGEGVGPAPAGTVGLREWTIVLEPAPLAALRERLAAAGIGTADGVVADPAGNRVRLVSAGGDGGAEGEGFEPSVRLPAQRFSRPPDSTTLAPLRERTAR